MKSPFKIIQNKRLLSHSINAQNKLKEIEEMHEYGYSKLKSVIPISPETAWKLFNEQWSIMLLYKNNSQELVSKRKLINPPRIIFVKNRCKNA